MDITTIAFRILHVLLGAFWAGTLIFFALFLLPSLRDVGPDGGKIMGALQKRGYVQIMPIVAFITILSGIWLYWRVSGGFDPEYMRSKYGMGYGLGGGAGILALALGLIFIRPAATKMGKIMQSLPGIPAGPEKDALMSEAQKLRQRTTAGSQIVALLLAFTVIMMAITRYL